MLDRTIPFYNIILKCDTYKYHKVCLPKGYSFSFYQEGFEEAWALLEYNIGDFESKESALDYFKSTYMSKMDLLEKKALFVLDGSNNIVGSCIAWEDRKGAKRSPRFIGLLSMINTRESI